jgi:multidrug efflux pump subunit AcrB
MNISEFSLRRPVFATVLNLMIILFGVVGYTFLAVRDYPAIDPAIINISTSYTGANPDIMESQVTEPLGKTDQRHTGDQDHHLFQHPRIQQYHGGVPTKRRP